MKILTIGILNSNISKGVKHYLKSENILKNKLFISDLFIAKQNMLKLKNAKKEFEKNTTTSIYDGIIKKCLDFDIKNCKKDISILSAKILN